MSVKETDRSMAGLREKLFDVLDKVSRKEIGIGEARTVCQIAQTILNSADIQMQYEKMRLDSKVPGVLPEMSLIPKLVGQKPNVVAEQSNLEKA